MTSSTDNMETTKTFRERFLQLLLIPVLAIFTSLIIGALVVIFTAETIPIDEAWSTAFDS